MTYYEFLECTYVKKHFYNLGSLTDKDINITMTEKTYTRHGNKWIIDSINKEKYTVKNYIYTLDAIPFFRSLGGFEKVEKHAVCPYGYIPDVLTSINPDRTEKIVREFTF